MAFRDHKVVGIIGYFLVGLSLLSFAARVTFKVATGHSLETYYSGTMIQWTYGAAFITLVVGVLAVVVAEEMRLIYLHRLK
jgi:hypothetical protein